MSTCFAIVARPRTGSNHLVSLLDSHPDIRCFGEVFRPGFKVSAKVHSSLSEFDDADVRADAPEQLIEGLKTRNSDATAVGFKIFPNHLATSRMALCAGVDKIVRIMRENSLAVYSSAQTAKVSGQGALRVGRDAKRVKVHFDPDDFDRFLRGRDRERRIIRRAVKIFEADSVFRLKYTDLNNSTRLAELQTFLSIEPREMTSDMQKRNPSDILARFDNPEQAAEHIADLGHKEWADE